jgi:hypothetical protein
MIHCCNSIDESFPGWSHSSDERCFFKIPVTPFVCGDMNSNPDFPFGTYRNQCLLSRYLPHVQGAVDRGRIDLPILDMRIASYPKPHLFLENHEKWSYSRSDWISEVRMGGTSSLLLRIFLCIPQYVFFMS